MRNLAASAISCFALLIFTTSGQAQTAPKSLKCEFGLGTTVTYAKGRYKSAKVLPLTFHILSIDLAGQKAALTTGKSNAKSVLRIVRAVNANHFLEVVAEGFLNTTTVYDLDKKTNNYPAVHSRHFGLFGEPVVAQYYGFCTSMD